MRTFVTICNVLTLVCLVLTVLTLTDVIVWPTHQTVIVGPWQCSRSDDGMVCR